LLEISQPFIISPSRVIGVIDPRNYKFSRVDQQAAVKASIRGKIIHRLIELGLSHYQDNPDSLTRFVRRYLPPISTEKSHSVNLGSNVTLWAKPDVVVGNPGQNCLCLEIKPGQEGKPVGGLKVRHVLQATLNAITVSGYNPPDVVIYQYDTDTLVIVPSDIQRRLNPLAKDIAISASKILYFEGYRRKLKDAGTIRRKKPDGQLYLFQPDQLSPEYLEARFDTYGLRAEIFEERRSILDPVLVKFNYICQRIK